MLNRDELKALFLKHSENSANDAVRDGRMNPDDHAMLIHCLKASRMEWQKADEYISVSTYHGFLSPDEAKVIMSVCAEYCPSKLD